MSGCTRCCSDLARNIVGVRGPSVPKYLYHYKDGEFNVQDREL